MYNPQAIVFYSVLGMFAVLGLVAGLIAQFRKERLWGLTVIGIVVNALLSLFFVVCSLPQLPSAFK